MDADVSATVRRATWESWQSFDELIAPLTRMTQGSYPWFVFRGHAKRFGTLLPGLSRLLKEWGRDASQSLAVEKTILNDFKRVAHLHFDPRLACPRDSMFEWFLMMQHHRAPTRLLDWSASPYVALYFAACEDKTEDAEWWAVPAGAVNNHARSPAHVLSDDARLESFFCQLPSGDPIIIMLSPPRWSDRMAAQAAWISVCSDLRQDHLEQFRNALTSQERNPTTTVVHLHIPKDKKHEIMRGLRQMNIDSRSLFPGVDGLGRSVAETAALYCQDIVRVEGSLAEAVELARARLAKPGG